MANLSTWTDIAEDRAESAHNPKLFLGAGLLGALFLGALLNPATAIAALAWGAYAAWEANEMNSDQREAVEEGIIAHLLDKKQLRQYLLAVGREQVAAELKMALNRELKLSDSANELAKRWNLKASTETDTLMLQPEPEPETKAASGTEPDPDQSDNLYTLPNRWQTVTDAPDMVQVWPHGAGDHPITTTGSADPVMREPGESDDITQTENPLGRRDPVALMAQTPFETVGPIRTDEFQLFSILKSQRRKQTDVIKIMYHCAKGGTDAYRKARDRYMVLLKLYCDIEQAS